MKKLIITTIILLVMNQIYYWADLQFKCTDKINAGKDLNLYEIASAYQAHTYLWMFGWVVSPEAARVCFNKQFHSFPCTPLVPEDDAVLKKAKRRLEKDPNARIRLTWRKYSSKASIYLNGSYISIWTSPEGVKYYNYEIPLDYKPGIIKIKGVAISETIFDYLEKKGILAVKNDETFQRIE